MRLINQISQKQIVKKTPQDQYLYFLKSRSNRFSGYQDLKLQTERRTDIVLLLL